MRREREGGASHRFTRLRHDERDVTEQILTDAVIAMSLQENISSSPSNATHSRGNSTMVEDLPPPPVRYVVPDRIQEAYARELQEKELEEPAHQIKEDEYLAKAIAMVRGVRVRNK